MKHLRCLAAAPIVLALTASIAVAQVSPGTSPLSGAKGGTGNAFMQFTGPATPIKTFTLPNASDTIATIAAAQTLTNKTFNCANNTCTVRIANDVTGLGTGCVTFLVTPSSANLRGCLTDEVGSGAFYTVGGALGTPASGTLTNATGLPPGGLAAQAAWTFIVNNTSGSATPTAVDIASLTTKASPAAGDYVILSDQAASGALKKATASSLASAGSVSSIAGNTGAFTLGRGITNSTNEIRRALNEASLSGAPSDPSGISSTGGLMAGMGSTCQITPTYSSRVDITFDGSVRNNTSGNGTTMQFRWGLVSGGVPSNGAALTGTAIGASTAYGNGTSVSNVPFSMRRVITGLTPGVAIWVDLVVAVTANTGNIANMTCTGVEF